MTKLIRALLLTPAFMLAAANAADLSAGVARVDITNYDAGPVNDPLYVKALVIKNGDTTLAIVAIVAIDAVAIGEIGHIKNDFLPAVRSRIQDETGIAPNNILINASHCHGVVHHVEARTLQAVSEAARNLVPVVIGAGAGHEDRIMENRRFLLKDGSQTDSRRAYSLPPDARFAGVGPVDPEIGVLRLDKTSGETLAAIYNFACHPIQGVPSYGNTGYAQEDSDCILAPEWQAIYESKVGEMLERL